MNQSTIKCHFCDRFLTYHQPSGHYNCQGHGDMNIAYSFSVFEDDKNLRSMTFIFGHPGSPWTYHHLHLSYHSKQTLLYFFGENWANTNKTKEAGLIFTLNHIVPGITAKNAQQALDKLLNLKVFS